MCWPSASRFVHTRGGVRVLKSHTYDQFSTVGGSILDKNILVPGVLKHFKGVVALKLAPFF